MNCGKKKILYLSERKRVKKRLLKIIFSCFKYKILFTYRNLVYKIRTK